MTWVLPGAGPSGPLGERVQASADCLRERKRELAAQSIDRRIDALVAWATAWTQCNDPYRREAVALLPEATGLSEAMVERGLDLAFESVEAHRLRSWWQREGGEESSVALSGHITSSNVFVAGLPPVVASLLAGVPAFLRPSSSAPEFGVLLARSWNERGLLGGEFLAAASWDRGAEAATRALLEGAERVFVFGTDQSIADVRLVARAQGGVGMEPLGFGHRLSLAAIGEEALSDDAVLERALEGLALDALSWDGAGCLTPRWVFVEGGPEVAERIARLAAPLLARAAGELPRGVELDMASGAERAGWLGRAGFEGWASQGLGWAVAALAEARLEPEPPRRSLVFLPVPRLQDLPAILAPLGDHLQGLAYAGAAERRDELASSLRSQGLSLAVAPGMLQRPPVDWNHDGVRILSSLV